MVRRLRVALLALAAIVLAAPAVRAAGTQPWLFDEDASNHPLFNLHHLTLNLTAEPNPVVGKASCWLDLVGATWTCRNPSGVASHGVQTSLPGGNFVIGIGPDGYVYRGGVNANQVFGLWPVAITGNGSDLNALSTPLDRLGQSGATTGQSPIWNGTVWAPGTISSGSDPLGFYVVTQASHAPVNAFNLGGLAASGLLKCSYSTGVCTPALAVAQASGATTGGADYQGPGAYLTGLGGAGSAGTATGPGLAPLTLNLAAGALVTGLLPLTNQAAPTGTGFVHITTGGWDAAARAVDLSSADATGTLAAARFPALTGCVTNTVGTLATSINLGCGAISGVLPAANLGTFTNGSVMFWSSGLAQDNAHFFWDGSNHRLGMGGAGTTTPSFALDMRLNTAAIDGVFVTNSLTTGHASVGVYDGTGGGFLRAYGQSFGIASLAGKVAVGADVSAGATGAVIFGSNNTTSGGAGSVSIRGGGYDTAAEMLLIDANGSSFTNGYVQAPTALGAGGIVKAAVTTGRLSLATVQASGSSAGGDVQGPGAYVTSGTGPVTFTGPGAAATAVNLGAGSVTGLLPCASLPALTGDLSNSGCTLTLGANVVTFAKFQQLAANSLLMNPTASTANAQAVSLGATAGIPEWVPGSPGTFSTFAAGASRIPRGSGTSGQLTDSVDLTFTSNILTVGNSATGGGELLIGGSGSFTGLTRWWKDTTPTKGWAAGAGTVSPAAVSDDWHLQRYTGTAWSDALVVTNSTGNVTFSTYGSGIAKLTSGLLGTASSSDLTSAITWPTGVLSGSGGALTTATWPASPDILVSTGTTTTPGGSADLDFTSTVLRVGNSANGGGALLVGGSNTQSGLLRFWKDTTPTKGASVGLSLPSPFSLTNDLIFGTYNGTAWAEWMRIANGGGVSIQSIAVSSLVKTDGSHVLTSATSGDVASTLGFPASPDVLVSTGTTTAPTGSSDLTWSSNVLNVGASSSGAGLRVVGGSSSLSGLIRFWKDNTPTKGWSIGPGTTSPFALTDDLRIQSYDGSSWLDRMVVTNGNGNLFVRSDDGLIEVPTGSNGVSTRWWKDGTPTKAVSVGNSIPGTAVGPNLSFSTYDGSAWTERMNITNAGGTVQIGSLANNSLVVTDGAHNLTTLPYPAVQHETWSEAWQNSSVGLPNNASYFIIPAGSIGLANAGAPDTFVTLGSIGAALNAAYGTADYPQLFTMERATTGGQFTCSSWYAVGTGPGTDTEVFAIYYTTNPAGTSATQVSAGSVSNIVAQRGVVIDQPVSAIPAGAYVFMTIYRSDTASSRLITGINFKCQMDLW